MKTKENVTIYYCDLCKKKGMRKDVILFHEKWCYNNPENDRACHSCTFLEESEIQSVCFDRDGYEYTSKLKGYRCSLLDKNVFSLEAERKGLLEKYPKTFENQVAMPKQCEFYKFIGAPNPFL